MLHRCSPAAAVLAFLAVGFVAGQDRKPEGGRSGTAKPAQPAPGAELQFNVQAFLKDFDKDGDGKLSKDEVPTRLRHHFEQMDTNKDGKLSQEELVRGVVYLQQRRRPSDMVFVLIETSDCDDGCAGEIQFAYDQLRRLDRNHDGKIDADELKAGREQLVQERLGNLIKDLDADGDGRISKKEARGLLFQNFDRLDTNRDGFIDREELLRGAAEGGPAKEKASSPRKDAPAPDRR